jgi:Flp pilus assembly protein TadG
MRSRALTFLAGLATRFRRASEASVLPTFTLALVPMVGMVGGAVDYSRANNVRTHLQAALDTAVLAGARDGTSNWINVATNIFNANVAANGATAASSVFNRNNDGTYAANASASVLTNFLGVMGTSSISIDVSSQAIVTNAQAGQFCLLALSSSAHPAIQLTGNAAIDVNAPQCVVQVNSNSASAVTLNGNTSISSSDNCFVGSVVKVGNATLAPNPKPRCVPVPDPFATYQKPSVGPCDYVNYSASGNKTITLQPGVYCGGMSFSGQVTVTFAPGLFIIKDGVLQANGGSSFTGNGVSFFLTGLGAGLQISGQGNWHVIAPSSGPLAGFVFLLDPNAASGPAASSSQLSGNAEMWFEGVIYLPKQLVTLTGGSQSFTPSPYTAYIMDTMSINGNGTLVINSDPTKTTVPIPAQLLLALDGRPRLVR